MTPLRKILASCCLLTFFSPVVAQPKADLLKVVLIGDSIRLGYVPIVAKKLADRMEIISTSENGADSANVLKHLDEWVIKVNPALVHINCGLHDLKKDRKTETFQVSLADYEANLKKIVARIQNETKARIIFASTTPIIDDRHANRKANFDRFEADVRRFNEIALRVMADANIPVNDLHAIVELAGPADLLSSDGTHYTPNGYEKLADACIDSLTRHGLIQRNTPKAINAGRVKQSIEEYTKAEADRDAAVPAFFKAIQAPELPIPKDAEAWDKQRVTLKKNVVASLGDLPARPQKQKVRLVCLEQWPGFRLEKRFIDNEAGNEIPVLLLIPEKRMKSAPAILWLHSSSANTTDLLTPNRNGGAEPLGITLVKKGYVVLGLDNWWHGDRAGTGPGGAKELGNDEQQSLHKVQLWLGRTLWGMFVRDDQIALDYLCSRPEVDAKRIGATGMSMGSTRAWWLAAVDDRIACTVGVACLTRYTNLIAHGQTRQHGVYYYVNGLLKHCDTEGVIALIAPRPFLALTGELDPGSPADGIKIIEEKAGGVYSAIGAKDRFRSIRYPELGHTHTAEMREETLKWFERWLK